MTNETKLIPPDNILFEWEKEIFSQHDNFEDYLFSIGVLSGHGGIKKVDEYRKLDRKWVALGYARHRREKVGGYVERKKWAEKFRGQFRTLVINASIEKPKKTDEEMLAGIETVDFSEEDNRGINVKDIPF